MSETSGSIYRPELIPRRGEWMAWVLAVLAGVVWGVLSLGSGSISLLIPFMVFVLLFSAGSISLSNWIDRHTVLRLDEVGVQFHNGLRNVSMNWGDIREMRVFPSRWGSKIQVFGERSYFGFRSLSEVVVKGELKGRMGFEQGEEIMRQIVLQSGLQIVDQTGNGYYYARV